MAGNIRDGTGWDCFDTFGGENNDGNGRDGKMMNFVVGWTGRHGTVSAKFRDGTGRYSTMTY